VCSSDLVTLEPGEYLVIYTDGVSEAANPQNEMFEEARLRKIMETYAGDTVEGLADAVKEGMRAFTEGAAQSDDITILVVQYKGNN
jgi:sigma-B regulation protein RsbU (phosphoserine phosphatase)